MFESFSSAPFLVDSHTHLEMEEFEEDRDDVVERARQAGIGLMITVGTNLALCNKALQVAARYPEVYVALGIHPHEVKDIDSGTYETLEELVKGEKVVAYGEIGLDFHYNLSPREIQITRFGEQLELAAACGLPVIIHNREAHKETLAMLEPWKGKMRGVIHCFSGDREIARKFIDLGFSISIPGTVTFKKAEDLREVVQYIPLENLLVETDAPFLAPLPHRGKRNEPAFAAKTALKLAELKGLSYDVLAAATTRNAFTLFGLTP